MSLLTVRGLSVAAGGVDLLRGFDATLGEGELVALVGASGSGKTTMLRTLARLVDPPEGEVLLRGRTAEQWGFPTYRRRVSFLAQRPMVLDQTVLANLSRPFRLRAAGASFPEARALALMKRLRLSGIAADRNARSLSEGERQRVCLVRTLLVEPDVLLLDEPTSALDAGVVEIVETVLREQVRAGRGAIVVTHDVVQAARLCDRVIELEPFLPVSEGSRRAG